jgi:RNA 2',3'-cyclic 3'-phosphodiesterase
LNQERARVFFALWPDAGTRGALAQAARRMHGALHGRRTRDDSIHLTLAFIGDVRAERLQVLTAPPVMAGVGPFTLTLDRCGCWPRNGIGWIAPSQIPDEVGRLVSAMEDWLRGVGFAIEERPYSPHVTLIRKARCVPLPEAIAPITWRAEDFVLVRSVLETDGSRYETIGRWPLRNSRT